MRIVVSGSSGLVGSALLPSLRSKGHDVGRMLRAASRGAQGDRPAGGGSAAQGAHDLRWDPLGGAIDTERLEGVDAVVNLAGESIAAGRWTAARKEAIRKSRINGTQLLAETLTKLRRPPRVMVSASAIGYYGDRGDEVLTETSARGHGFLPAVAVGWESATERAEKLGVRVVHLRFGVILSASGGALAKMLTPFRLGLGGPVGSGRQFLSWIALDDVVRAIEHALATETLRGPVNTVAPNPVTNLEFTRILARVLHRPAFAPFPAFAARLIFGEMADALLLASARVKPEALIRSGFTFRFPELEPALRQILKH